MDQWGGYHIIYVYTYIPAARHLPHAATSKTCIQLEFCASLEPGFRNNYATCPEIDLLNNVSHVLLYMWYETGALLESRVCRDSGSGPSVGISMEFGGGKPGFTDYGAGTSVTERDEA